MADEIKTNTAPQNPTSFEQKQQTTTESNTDEAINNVPDTDTPATGYEEIDNLKSPRTDILDENFFSLPQDRDFYINAVDIDWYTQFADAVKEPGLAVDATKAAAFYMEEPPIMNPGYYPDKYVYVLQPRDLKAFSTVDDVFMGVCDGDTIKFTRSACLTGDQETADFLEQTAHEIQNKLLGFSGNAADADFMDFVNKQSYDTVEVRILGIDCPEVPHLSPLSEKDYNENTISTDLSSEDNNLFSDSVYVKYECTNNFDHDSRKWTFTPRNPQTDTKFIRIGTTYHEVLTRDQYMKIRGDQNSQTFQGQSVTPEYLYLSVDDTKSSLLAQGNAAARLMHTLIQQSTDARIMVAANTQATKGDNSYPVQYLDEQLNDAGYWHQLKEFAMPFLGQSLFKHAGFNQIGQDLYGRILGALYLYGPYGNQGQMVWINAAKYILTQTPQTQVNKSINGSVVNGKLYNALPAAFKPESYEWNERMLADALWQGLSKFDDRHKIQAQVFDAHRKNTGLYSASDFALSSDLSKLADWTVILGDISLMVPPTSIRCITQTTTERVPVVRAKGTIAKGYEHSDRLLELHLYFNGDEGINGVPITVDLPIAASKQAKNPNDGKITYYMNGLRALVAAFKLTPYMPIENTYINTVLNVNAVCFQNISIQTVPNFPKLLQCVVTLREFDPSSFMPQLPVSYGDMDYHNYFAKAINYETMRYYYQQPLILGNKLAEQDSDPNTPLDITSKKYMEQTLFANRTAMMPCRFLSPTMSFYIASEDYLKELLTLKNNMANKAAGGTFAPRTEVQQKFMDDVTPLAKAILDLSEDTKLASLLDVPNGVMTSERWVTVQRYMIRYLKQNGGPVVASVEPGDGSDPYFLIINLEVPYITNEELLRTLKDQAGNSVKVNMNNALENMQAKLYIRRDEKTKKYYVVTGGTPKKDDPFEEGSATELKSYEEGDDTLFLGWCAANAGTKGANDVAEKQKQSIDVEDEDSIHFELYLKDVRIDSVGAAFSNVMTSVALQDSDSIAPQYMGGTDTDITVSITTTNKVVAGMLDRLPKLSSYLHRTYHRVLPMYPVKIDSEFTRMLGITEVSFDNIVVNTVPNYPDMYSIQITMKSTDRTLRNREALRRVNVKDHSNEHITNENTQNKDRAKTYFDLADTISQINLYPDLELPSIDELRKAGFQFIRYKNRTMKYPDPDFYFVYPGIIFNETIRETVRSFLTQLSERDGNTTFKDGFGAQFQTNGLMQIDFSKANETYKTQLKYVTEIKQQKLEEERKRAEASEKALGAAMVPDLGSWDIGPRVKVTFMETYYYRQLMLYLNQIKLGIFKHNTDADTNEEKKAYEESQAQDVIDAADAKKAEEEKAKEEAKKTEEQKQEEQRIQDTNNKAIEQKDPNPNPVSQAVTDEEKKKQAQSKDISYQATKGLHLYDRLQVLRDVIANILDNLSQSPDDSKIDYFDFSEMARQYISVFAGITMEDRINGSITEAAKAASDTMETGGIIAAGAALIPGVGAATVGSIAAAGSMSAAVEGTAKIAAGVYNAYNIPRQFNNLVVAALAAKAGRKECDSDTWTGGMLSYDITSVLKNKTEMWLPDSNVVGVVHNDGKQDSGGYKYVTKDMLNFTFDDYKQTVRDSKALQIAEKGGYSPKAFGEAYDAKKNAVIDIQEPTDEQTEQLLDDMDEVGIFRIKFYTMNELNRIIAPDKIDIEQLSKKGAVGGKTFVLDPYYRYQNIIEIRKFKKRLIQDPKFCLKIFMREMMFWLYRLYSTYTLPSITMDIHRKEAMDESKILQQLNDQLDKYNDKVAKVDKIPEATKERKEAGAKHTPEENYNARKDVDTAAASAKEDGSDKYAQKNTELQRHTARAIATFLKDSGDALDLGKIFAALSLTITNGDVGLQQAMRTRDYKALNGYVKEAAHTANKQGTKSSMKTMMRKFILACIGTGVIASPEEVGKSPALPSEDYISQYNLRKVLQANNNPSLWLKDSFLDMIQSDFRGRMLRAFPTFYMILVDEGRDLGYWKLHDNFYNTNAVSEIKIMKSRKNPADTCTITMSNLFSTFTDQDEDGKYNFNYGIGDVFSSIFTPQKYAEDEEIKRQMVQEINKAKIRTGARMHLRLGYGNDASIMPLAFNGVITNVQEGPVVQLIAQGDGLELTNPILDVDDDDLSDSVMFRENLTGSLTEDTGGQTPKFILDTLLTQRGGWLAKQFKDSRFSRFFNQNPYGLFHFGDRDFKDIIPDGEPTQNIYEVDKNPSFGWVASKTTQGDGTTVIKGETKGTESIKAGHEEIYSPEEGYDGGVLEFLADDPDIAAGPPLLSFYIANKSIWDIMHIVRSASPEFITSVAPFNFRSTIFMGRPHYYYAYDYKQVNGGLVEKRKPFQQWHIYFTSSDIINDQITTSQDKIKTVVTGLFKRKTPFLENCKVGPLYADYSIYPENQRSVLFDTQYVARFQNFMRGYPGVKSKDSKESDGFLSQSASGISQKVANLFTNARYMLNEVLPEDWLNDRPHKLAWNMSASKLKDSMAEMYQGQLLVIGDPSVKPYDRIMFEDLYRDLQGQALVRDVTHMFSAQAGFTTAITPDCIIAIDDRDEYIKQTTLQKIMFTAGRTLLSGLSTYGLIRYLSKKGDPMVQSLMKTMKEAWNKLKNVQVGKKGKALIEGVKSLPADLDIKNAKGLKGVMEAIIKWGKTAATGAKYASGLRAMLSFGTRLASVAGALVLYIGGSCLIDGMTNYVKNLRVAKVFPLKRYGRPYTAGLDGSHALIVGSPTENQEDTLGKVVGTIFAPGKGDDFGTTALNFIKGFAFGDELMSIGQKYVHESGVVDQDGNPIQTETDFQDFQKEVYKGNMYYEGAATNLATVPRCAIDNGGDIIKYAAAYQASSASAITTDPAIGKMQVITEYPSLDKYVKNRFLRLIHNGQKFSDIRLVKEYVLKNKGKNILVYGIVNQDGNVDLPILHEDACVVLSDIVQKTYTVATAGAGSNQTDTSQEQKDMDSQFLSLKKAYTVGDNNVYARSGFSFTLEPHGNPLSEKFEETVREALNAMNKKDASGKTTVVAEVKKVESEYIFVVTIPKKG